MQPFTTLSSRPTPFVRDNVDTDLIIPAAYLKTVSREGLGRGCFETVRYDAEGQPRADSVFDQPAYAGSQILVGGDNFGCGSSREHAVWALADLGFRCVIAESFADIFASNCFKNGVLTVRLDRDAVTALAAEGEAGRAIAVDLDAQTVTTEDGTAHRFEIDPFRKHCLIEGLDEVALTLDRYGDEIAAFEAADRLRRPWLHDAA
ncbi:3-isopropylmalate dehydratase small subunit [Rhodothalassium salexigens]|uniref:3-isopropylmalate dehydratase small subunit n=1 Tax=Rhodothalassium salexigens TaxID=1086 RepID=UPI001913B452|nr:3-isopropylmalate dehydratase small subunit [Rhodothalassium salexigens]MBK5910338.1 3-isopropylmalate dehydratase small subunit [Rhodothalassium salexigens]MBK5921049.1 3-isopropylmalate dehydratase small subunit [Rhodothalassium salexigens]